MVVVCFTFHNEPVQYVTVLGMSLSMTWIGLWSQWTLDAIWFLLSERHQLRGEYVSAERCLNRVVLMQERRDSVRMEFADVHPIQDRSNPLSLNSRTAGRD